MYITAIFSWIHAVVNRVSGWCIDNFRCRKDSLVLGGDGLLGGS